MSADDLEFDHNCSKPYDTHLPYLSSQDEIDKFIQEIKEYQNCVIDFFETQRQLIEEQSNIDNEMVNEWDKTFDL